MTAGNIRRWLATRRSLVAGAGITIGILALWEILAVTVFSGRFVVPAPSSVVATAFQEQFYYTDLLSTLNEASRGWLIGNGLAVALASLCILAPGIEPFLLSAGVVTYAVPTIAVGPLLVVVMSSFGAKVTFAAVSVFFVTLVAATIGLRAASRTSLDLVTAFGGGRWTILRKVRLRAAVPSLASGLALSAPAAILGAIIGDYLGGQSGLGVVMLQAQQDLEVSRTWAIALVATGVSGLAFGLTALLARAVGGGPGATVDVGSISSHQGRSWLRALPIGLAKIVLSTTAAIVLWAVAVKVSGLSSFFAKTPADVWQYVASGPGAAANRQMLLSGLWRTLHDASIGWAAGTVVAVISATALTLMPSVSAGVYPLVLVLRSVPLVAMTPLIALVFGRGLLGVSVIAGIVTFVPSLVTLSDGLRMAPSAAMEMVSATGGSRWQELWKIRFPYAAPSGFAAARISMPGAMLGAILAEWLITGNGIGSALSTDVTFSAYSNLWSAVVLVIVVSLLLYFVVGGGEKMARRHLAMD